MGRPFPTAPLAAGGLIAGFAVALASGSRLLGGLVLAAFGLVCVLLWRRRDGTRTAAVLTAAGLLAFALSHVLGLVVGAGRPCCTAVPVAAASWQWSDARAWRQAR